jgi:hypothetical protein
LDDDHSTIESELEICPISELSPLRRIEYETGN